MEPTLGPGPGVHVEGRIGDPLDLALLDRARDRLGEPDLGLECPHRCPVLERDPHLVGPKRRGRRGHRDDEVIPVVEPDGADVGFEGPLAQHGAVCRIDHPSGIA